MELRYRLTDRIVSTDYGINPLSVSSDKIAVLAWRCAQLLSEAPVGFASPGRDGADGIVEVYPAGALKVWDFKHRGRYKGGRNAAEKARRQKQRTRLVTELEERAGGGAGWLKWADGARDICVSDDDALDAVLSALIARAAATNQTRPPAREERKLAAIEGWIHIPEPDSFGRLPWGRAAKPQYGAVHG